MKLRTYALGSQGIRIALLTDLHNKPWKRILAQVEKESPAIIAIAGDLAFHYTKFTRIGGFLTRCAEIAPTYLSLGNHDSLREPAFCQAIAASSVTLLDDGYVDIRIGETPLRIGGLTAPALASVVYPVPELQASAVPSAGILSPVPFAAAH